MNKSFVWVAGAIGTAFSALSLVKLVSHFFAIGLAGVPAFVLAAYSEFVADVQYWLLKVPFDLSPPAWVMHVAVVWLLFVGSNVRFLTYNRHGQKIYRGLGDVGRGTRRPLDGWALALVNWAVSATGPLFTAFVFLMWSANRRGGPTGAGHWGDDFMISNRIYTVRISRIYLLVLLLAPITAAIVLTWGAAGNLPRQTDPPPGGSQGIESPRGAARALATADPPRQAAC